jgi:hypothetical protein
LAKVAIYFYVTKSNNLKEKSNIKKTKIIPEIKIQQHYEILAAKWARRARLCDRYYYLFLFVVVEILYCANINNYLIFIFIGLS